MIEETEREDAPSQPSDVPEADPSEGPGPRENPESDQGKVEEGEEQLDQVSGN